MKGGVQSVTTKITQMTSLIPDVTDPEVVFGNDTSKLDFWMQLASISYATQALFLGSIVRTVASGATVTVKDTRPAGQPSFLDIYYQQREFGLLYSWGDVLKGIEEISHNVTAALLSLSLGTINANCSFDQQDVVYQYTPFALWVPYGVSNFFFTPIF